MSIDVADVREKIRVWFFEAYVPHAMAIFRGEDPSGLRGFLNYWKSPLLFTSEKMQFASWLKDDEQIVGAFKIQDDRLRAAGYASTRVPDQRITVYNQNGGGVDVIWSRLDGDDKEIERLALHFEVARVDGDWRIVAVQTRITDPLKDQNSVEKAWAVKD